MVTALDEAPGDYRRLGGITVIWSLAVQVIVANRRSTPDKATLTLAAG